MAFNAKPDDLSGYVEANKKYYSRMVGRMKRWHALYERQFRGLIRLPQNVPVHESSTPAIIVDELRDQIRIDEPQITAQAFGTSARAVTLRQKQEMWGQAVIEGTANQGLQNPYAQARHDLINLCYNEGP